MTARRQARLAEGADLGFWDRVEDVALGALPHLLPLRPVTSGNRITYRKHWFALLREVVAPLLLLTAEILVLTLFLSPFLGALLGVTPWWADALIWLVLVLPVIWLLWRYENWRNDYYVIAPDRLIDVDKDPLGFRKVVREAPMGMVQNISMTMPNAIAATFDFGNVIIETAGRDGVLTFTDVHHPREVMATLSQRVDAFRSGREQAERDRRQQEMVDWFRTYADMASLAIVGNPPSTQVGEEVAVEWRVSSGREVETWLEWQTLDGEAGGARHATRLQPGGAGNYRDVLRAGLGHRLVFQAVALVDGQEKRSQPIIIPIADFSRSVTRETDGEQDLVVVSWTSSAQLDVPGVEFGYDDALTDPGLAPVTAQAGGYRAGIPDDGGPLWLRLCGQVNGRELDAPIVPFDPSAADS